MADASKKLTLIIDSKVNSAVQGLNQVSGKLESAGSTLAGAFGGMGGLAGIASVGGVVAILGNVAKKGADIADGAKRIGVTTDEYQQLAYAAQQTGTDIGTVEGAFSRMNRMMYGADEESKQAQSTLQDLGLSLDDLKTKTPEQKFSAIAAALRNVQDSTQRAGLAQQVFGRDAQSLMPMINEYEALKQEVQDMGAIMSAEAVDAAMRLGDTIDKLTTQFTALVANTGVLDFLAGVAEGINAITTNATRMDKMGMQGTYAQDGFWWNLKDAYFGELEGEKIHSYGDKDSIIKAKIASKNAPKPKTRIETLTDRGAAIEEEIMALEDRKGASAMDSDKLMFQGEINKKMVEYRDLLKEASAAGIKVAGEQLKKLETADKEKKAMEDIVGEMEQQILIQDMIASGAEKEAYVKGELYKLQKTHPDRANTEGEEKIIRNRAETLYTQKGDKVQNDALAEMKEQIRIQELLNAGKGKQVFIEETLAKIAKERGEALSKEARDDISDMAGKLYDSKNKTPGVQSEAVNVDQLAKIGGYNFGGAVTKTLDVERNNLLRQIAQKVGIPQVQEVLA